MKTEELNKFCQDLTFGMDIVVLEDAKDKDEIAKIALAHKIQMPCRDLAILKCKFAFTNEQNGNGCTLPAEEVSKALGTIGGKAVDIDHFRNVVRGHWLEGYLDGDTIYAYAVVYKEQFKKDFAKIKQKFSEGKLKISMESWGVRVYTNNAKTEYYLKDIEFSGGAILLNTKPAFQDAEVLEMAKEMGFEEPVLEFAHIKETPAKETKADKILELARFYSYDFDTIRRLVYETTCPECIANANDPSKVYAMWTIDVVDFANGLVKISCADCKSEYVITVSPRIIADVTNNASQDTGRKIIKTEAKLKEEKVEKNSLKDEDTKTKKVMEDMKTMNEQEIKALQEKVLALEAANATLKTQNETLKVEVANANTALETAKVTFATEKTEAIKVAAENAKLIAERKAELGAEFAKDMKDEDILNADKFELAKANKKNAELAAALEAASKGGKKVEKAAVTPEKKVLEAGGKNKNSGSEISDIAKRVTAKAFATPLDTVEE